MTKKTLTIIMVFLCIILPASAWGTLYYYSGTMDAQFEVTYTIEITLPSGFSTVSYEIALPENYSLPTNSQIATDPVIEYTDDPPRPADLEEDETDAYGNHNTVLTWNNPSAGTIAFTIAYTITTSADWDAFETSDAFPFNSTGLSESITKFLDATDEVQSDNSTLVSQAETLTSGITTQWEAVLAIIGWVMDNVTYGTNQYGTDALSTYDHLVGVCTNYSQLAIALLRAAGIPARFASGDSINRQYTLPIPNGYRTTYWNQGPHAWIEVYYPSLGEWVPYDPQRDIHHIDTYRVLTGIGKDTDDGGGGLSSSWIGEYPGPISWFTNMNVNEWLSESVNLTYIKQTDEITDFSLSTAVTFTESHTITASAGSGGSISPSGAVSVSEGADQAFTITPDSGYDIEDVLVDSVSQGALTSYTFSDVSDDHTIEASFIIDTDVDDDGLPDSWEQQIIDHNQSDGITSIQDVLPGDDFDGDGYSNLEEYQAETDPTDSSSPPSKFMPWLPLLLE